MNKLSKIGMICVLAAMAAACTPGDKFNPDREIVLFTGTDSSPLIKVNSDSYMLTVSATGIATEDVTVYLEYDASVVDTYNAVNKTAYQAVPKASVSMASDRMLIKKGQASSEVNQVKLVNQDFAEDGVIYLIPLVITKVEGGGFDLVESGRSILIRPTKEYRYAALDVADANLSSNYIFPDDKAMELSVYTYEIKIYSYSFSPAPDQPIRLCAWDNKDESLSTLLRFGEDRTRPSSLQVKTPGGNTIYSDTDFDVDRWYMLSFVYDGSATTMYVDGVAEPQKASSTTEATVFQRFEIGMSWGGYTSRQLFKGRISEVRIWDRALSVNEMKEGICGVAKDAEGLRAYWKFNEGSGHIFHDATGNGYDLDWSKTVRDPNENGTLVEFDKSAIASQRWVNDDINVCHN